MPDAMSALSGVLSNPATGPVLSGATLGLGEVGNLLAGHAASQQEKALQNQENAITNLTPAELTAKVTSAENPINNALVQAINNSVQGDVASRGLAQAPGIFASEESQALAPYAQQNYNTALNQVMQQLGLPIEYANAIKSFLPGQQNMTPAMQLFLQQLAKLKTTNASGTFTGGGATQPTLAQITGLDPSQQQVSTDTGGIDPGLLQSITQNFGGAS